MLKTPTVLLNFPQLSFNKALERLIDDNDTFLHPPFAFAAKKLKYADSTSCAIYTPKKKGTHLYHFLVVLFFLTSSPISMSPTKRKDFINLPLCWDNKAHFHLKFREILRAYSKFWGKLFWSFAEKSLNLSQRNDSPLNFIRGTSRMFTILIDVIFFSFSGKIHKKSFFKLVRIIFLKAFFRVSLNWYHCKLNRVIHWPSL